MPSLHQSRVATHVKAKGAKPDLRTTPSKGSVNAELKKRLADAELRLQHEKDARIIKKLQEIISNLRGAVQGH